MRIHNDDDNGNVPTIESRRNLSLRDSEEGKTSNRFKQSNNIDNNHLWTNANDHVNNKTNFKTDKSTTNESTVCNHLYKLSRLLKPDHTFDENITSTSSQKKISTGEFKTF